MNKARSFLAAAAAFWLAPAPAAADQASVLDATVTANGDGSYSFSATVRHGDTGWKHYADKFEVLGPDGKVLGTRVLYHPHVDEQPFTRSLGRVQIPIGVTEVTIRAHDKVHGDGKRTFKLKLPPRR
ncbi:MAG: hypothetical protein OXR84_00540 [Magnetovibrio sp.]|nr:hypothetical protein [Magnetovibrio sp.]